MNGISILLLVLQALEIFSGSTPPNGIIGEDIIQPAKYSWIAQLVYKNGYDPECKGSVISAWHILTAAQCATDELIGVRLGEFYKDPKCRDGTTECHLYMDYQIANITVDDQDNGIALVGLTKEINLGHTVKRICLPLRWPQLTEVGYILFINLNELTTKEAVIIPLLAKTKCDLQSGFMMCTGVFAAIPNNQMSTCQRIFGRSRRSPMDRRSMVVQGIQPYVQGDYWFVEYSRKIYAQAHTMVHNCCNRIASFFKTVSTRFGSSPSRLVEEHKLPTECGYSPIYPRELMDGGYKIQPDEFSWLASLVYEKDKSAFGYCSGSVISSRYVLTAARCVQNDNHPRLGNVVGVRLGNFEREPFCDYGVESCKSYQYFEIENFKVHENYRPNAKRMNDIALLKLKGNIEFGDKMTPICVPIGKNSNIEEPEMGSFLTVAGWWTTTFPSDSVAKRSEAVAFWNTTGCMEADRDRVTQVCGVRPGRSPCTSEFGSPLMNMFERRRMVLEGIAYDGVAGCPGQDVGTLYTKVREYGEWIKSSIESLETISSNGKKPGKSNRLVTWFFNQSRNWQY